MNTIRKSDQEIAADMRQLWQELVRMKRQMEKRGYEVDLNTYIGSDKATVDFSRKQENIL